jgi:AraC-like DNA-binding protein
MDFDKVNFKKDGFDGQKAIVLPKSIINKFCINNSLIDKAYITDLGYYPKAKFHYRKRPYGAEQNILIYCIEGKGEIILNKKTYCINADDFFMIPRGVAHIYETDLKNPWTIYWCHFKGSQTDEIIKQVEQKYGYLKARVPFSDARIKLFEDLYSNLEKGYSFENISYVNLVFLQFLSSFIFSDKFNFSIEEEHDDTIEKSIKFMQINLDKSITLKELSKYVNCSASHYSSVFRKKTGFPPVEYLNHLKIQKSCQYLQFTDLRIKEIAAKIGIDDQYYFSRLFTKTMGFSPSDYRKNRSSVQ